MSKLTILACLLLAGIAHAQSPSSKKGLGVRFLAERGGQEAGKVVLAVKDTKSPPFDLTMNQLSDSQTPPGRAFNLQTSDRNVPLASITLPEKGNSFIVLLIPSAKTGYDPVVMSAEDPNFRPGDIYFYNNSDKTVLGYVGTSKFTLAPKKGEVLRPTGANEEGHYYSVGLGVREAEGDRPLSTARWPVQKRMRMYVFFFTNPKTGTPDFRAVDEYVEPEG